MNPKRRTKIPPQKQDPLYKVVWPVVDGAVADAFNCHPEYVNLNNKISLKTVRTSINKRVVGAIVAAARQGQNEKSG